jgi:hypothetical protein
MTVALNKRAISFSRLPFAVDNRPACAILAHLNTDSFSHNIAAPFTAYFSGETEMPASGTQDPQYSVFLRMPTPVV